MHKTFSHNVKIYYEDTDSGGVVYYANYLKYFERARTEALLTIGLSNLKIKDEFNSLIIVKSCNIEYKKSAYLEDNLIIKSFISSLSKTSLCSRVSLFGIANTSSHLRWRFSIESRQLLDLFRTRS